MGNTILQVLTLLFQFLTGPFAKSMITVAVIVTLFGAIWERHSWGIFVKVLICGAAIFGVSAFVNSWPA